ncbi:MAG TPA: TonB-dependent receptor [Blastocatellia bacterium]|nr:TonB-dependent receptor [Blastocatellia bacterium]
MSEVKRLLIMSLLFALFPVAAMGQQTSAVTGVVTDSTGAVINGVEVKLTDTKTAAEQSTKTNEQGVYLFARSAPGSGYKLTFTAQGFDTVVMTNVTLGVGITETINTQMSVGQVTNTVTVASTAETTLNTTDASVGNVINTRQLTDLPIQIRNSPAALLSLQTGVVGNNLGAIGTNRTGSVTGGRADQGNITIDGIDANDQTTGQAFATVGNAPIDAIQEFRAVSANPNASDGRSSGGQIELVTKSGSNNFHGSLREYNRTAKTAANSFFNNRSAIARPQLTRNQFGGSIGGPVYLPGFSGKDKLFFFFDYEGRRDAQGVSNLRTVPLNHVRNGGLAYVNNASGCAANSRLNTTPNCVTILSAAQVAALDPKQQTGASRALLDFVNSRYPQANDLTAGDGVNTGGFRFNSPSHRTDTTYTTRIDWSAAESQKVFGRFNIARRTQTDTVNTVAQQFPGDPESGQIIDRSYGWVVGHTWTFNPNLVNQATVGVTNSVLDFPRPFKPAFPNNFTFGPYSAPFAGIASQDRTVPVPTIRDDVTWTKRAHSLEFGISAKPIQQKSGLINDLNFLTVGLGGLNTNLDATLRPADIRSADTTNIGQWDAAFPFLLGRVALLTTNFNYDVSGSPFPAGTGKNRNFHYNEFEAYAQDTWRARNDLTLTYGVRWHYYSVPFEADGFQAVNDVDFRNFFDLRARNAATGISGPTAEPFLRYDLGGKANNARGYSEPDLNNFAPRFSFSYNPSFKTGFLGKLFGDRKTVIRGGGSLVYDRVGGAITFIQDQVSYLFDNSVTQLFGNVNPRTALINDPRFISTTNLPVSNTAPAITRPFTPFVEGGVPTGNATQEFNFAVDQNFVTPYSIVYSFGLQRELPGNLLLEAGYVGRQGRKLFTQADAAQVLDFKDPASGQSMLAAFNALQAQVQAGVSSANTTSQPWFENQMTSAIGVPCSAIPSFGGRSCTRVVRDSFLTAVTRGNTAPILQSMYGSGLLNPNVGLSGQFSNNLYISNQGSSSYNGLLLSLRKRFSNNLQLDFNYTFSHSIDNQSSVVNTVSGGIVCDLRNLRVCRGNSDFDVRHVINANWIYYLPFGRGERFGGSVPGWLNTVIGGWGVTGIYSWRTGLAFSTASGAAPVVFGIGSPAVFSGDGNALGESIHDSGSTIQFFGDPTTAQAALRFPRHGEIGTRNNLRGPGFWNVDLNVLKNFRLPWSERHKLQFRWEMYNAFNHNSFALPNANITQATFGQITGSASIPREMQFALRLEF